MNRAELHIHTKLSEDRSVVDPHDAIRAAIERGCPAVAFVDKNTVQSFPTVAKLHQKYRQQIQVIYGTEIAVADDTVTLLVRDDQGFSALYRVVTTHDLTPAQREHLLVGAGKDSALHQAVAEGNSPALWAELARRYDYIELFPTAPEATNRILCALGAETGVPVVAVGDCHYLTPADRLAKELLDHHYECPESAPDTHLRTTEEMLAAFAYLGQETAKQVAITAPNDLAQRITATTPTQWAPAHFSLPGATEQVQQLCEEALTRRYGDTPPQEIRARLDVELLLFSGNQHASYYLLAHHLACHLRQQGKPTGCRGTLGSSLAAYLLGFSDTNPLPAHYYCPVCRQVEFAEADCGLDLPNKICPTCGAPMQGDGHNLSYEMAMGLDGTKTPDVSLIVPADSREEALRFLNTYLGEGRVAFAGSVQRIRPKTAQGIARFENPNRQPPYSPKELEHIIQHLNDVKLRDSRCPGVLFLLPEGMTWEQVTPLRPLDNPQGGVEAVTCMDYPHIHRRLPHISLLSHTQLDRLQEMHRVTGVQPEEIAYNDPEVYRLFEELDTEGLADFATGFFKSLLHRIDRVNFSDLVRLNAMGHGTQVWTDNGEEFFKAHPLRDLITTRDEAYQTLLGYGVDHRTAYNTIEAVRKGGFDRDTINNDFLTGLLREAGVPEWYIASLKRVRYLFPKAHAATSTKTAVALAWFKRYHPAAFYQVTLSQPWCARYRHRSSEELEQALDAIPADDRFSNPEKEAILLVLEARRKGYAAE